MLDGKIDTARLTEAAPDLAVAREVIDAEKRTRVEAFVREINEAAARYKCTINAVPIITADGKLAAEISVRAN